MGTGGSGTRGGLRATALLPSAALTLAGWVVGIVVTAMILGTPYLVFGYHNASLHLVLESIDGCVALLVAYLLYGRFVRTRRLQDLLLSEAMFLLAVAGLGLTLLLDLLVDVRPATLNVWLPLALRVLGAALIVAAAFAGRRAAHPSVDRWARITPWLVVALAFGLLWFQRDQLPVALPDLPPASAQRPVITGHAAVLGAQAVTALSFMAASLAFAVQAARREDELLRWLGPALALGAFARVNYLLFPSLYSDWLYTGDILRTGSYLVLLVGAAREIGQYWSAHARAAVLDDRRRLARELHDGVVQELAYIRSAAHDLSSRDGSSEQIVASCDRALDEARAAIDALGRGEDEDEDLSFVLHQAARQVAERYDGHLEVDLDDSVTADPEQRHALVRITREAVSNALRHGKPDRVHIQVGRDPNGRRLVVQDDGEGFDVDTVEARSSGYGLTSMRDRARALPGSLTIQSKQGRGTEVTVKW